MRFLEALETIFITMLFYGLLVWGATFTHQYFKLQRVNTPVSDAIITVAESRTAVHTENVHYYEPDMVTVDKSATIRDNLVTYVYKYSKNISRDMAMKIVDQVMKTDQPALMIALIRRESNFNPTVVSSAKCIGLGQIHPRVWTKVLIQEGLIQEERDLYNIPQNVQSTFYIFKKMWDQSHGNLEVALTKYYGGPHKTYVKAIMDTYFEVKWIMESV